MRFHVLALAIVLFGCDSKKSATEAKRAPLVDLTSTSGLGAARTAFNAHKGKARFLTLLSPT